MPLPNYVKFKRGTPTAYANLKTNNLLDSDTLYFISETPGQGEEVTSGKLYLGAKLISGSGEGGSISNLSELHDVLVGNLNSNQVLTYDKTAGKWKNVSIAALIEEFNNITFSSSVFETTSGGETTLKGFESAAVGTLPSKGTNGQISWIQVPSADLSPINEAISSLETTIDNMYTNGEIDTLIASANHLKRQIVNSLEDIDTDSSNDYTIYMVPTGNLTGNKYDEYMVIENNLEPIGNGVSDLDGYVTTEELNSTLINYATIASLGDYLTKTQYENEVGNYSTLNVDEANYTLVDQVNALTQRLAWVDMD